LLKKYSSSDFLGIELTAIYWHFLDALWVYLFLFLYFYR
jgi:cytochrome c oxidase subunit 3